MKKSLWVYPASFALVAVLCLPVGAQAATLFLDSWGVSYGNWEVNSFAPPDVAYEVEDWTGGNNGFLGPGWGGDAYDVEAAYIGTDDDYLYLAVVTGFPLVGRAYENDYYEAGDLAIDLDCDGSQDFAVDVSAGGLLRSGNLVWENPSINGAPVWNGISDPLRVTSWDNTSAVSGFNYSAWQGRYVIEAKIARNDLGPTDSYCLRWTMGCGNDGADVAYDRPADPVPEPASLLLLGSGLGVASLWARRRRKV